MGLVAEYERQRLGQEIDHKENAELSTLLGLFDYYHFTGDDIKHLCHLFVRFFSRLPEQDQLTITDRIREMKKHRDLPRGGPTSAIPGSIINHAASVMENQYEGDSIDYWCGR